MTRAPQCARIERWPGPHAPAAPWWEGLNLGAAPKKPRDVEPHVAPRASYEARGATYRRTNNAPPTQMSRWWRYNNVSYVEEPRLLRGLLAPIIVGVRE